MTIKEYAKGGAEVLRSSERMVREEIKFSEDCETPEAIELTMNEARTLASNLAAAAALLDLVGEGVETLPTAEKGGAA